jgi:hypothetical protein
MYKVSQEFSFVIGLDGKPVNIIGQLIFEKDTLNEFGSLNTEEEFKKFTEVLNSLTDLPIYWTLETLSKIIYERTCSVFSCLVAVNLSIKEEPTRIAEYTHDFLSFLNGEETQWKN